MSGGGSKAVDAAHVVRASARAFERDRYLAALLAPSAARDGLIALAAFAGEIGRVPALVNEPMMGELRLQWWRDALSSAADDDAALSGNPNADALAAAIRRHRLPLSVIENVLDAQSARLDDRPFATAADLAVNLASLEGGLFELAWRTLGGKGAAPPLLVSAGRLYGMARLLIEMPAVFAQGRVLLPTELLARHGVGADAVPTAASAARWRGLVRDALRDMEAQITDVSRGYQEADSSVRLAALPLAVLRPYFRLIEQADPAAMESRDIGPFTRVWCIWRCSRTSRI